METLLIILVIVLLAGLVIWQLSLELRVVKLVIKFFRSLR